MSVTWSAAAAAQAAIGNVAQQAKAVPGKLNSLLSKYAPGLAEVDMKRCNLDISLIFDLGVD
jgi:hypothetical protein